MLVRQSFLAVLAIALFSSVSLVAIGRASAAQPSSAHQPTKEFRLTTSDDTSPSSGPSMGPPPKKRGQVLYHGPAKKKPLFDKSKALIVLGGLCLGVAIYTTTRESKRKD